MKRAPLLLLSAVLAILLTYGFWPLSSKQLEITFDKEKITAKQAYLSALRPDSAPKPNIIIIMADDLGLGGTVWS